MNWFGAFSKVAIDRMPKKISPGTHAAIDYALALATAGYAVHCLRHNKAASVAGFMAALSVVTNVAMTDIPGGVCKEISFPLHGRVDLGTSAMLAAMPRFMGFAREPESRFFYGSAIFNTVVISLTDFTGTGETAQSRKLLSARE